MDVHKKYFFNWLHVLRGEKAGTVKSGQTQLVLSY